MRLPLLLVITQTFYFFKDKRKAATLTFHTLHFFPSACWTRGNGDDCRDIETQVENKTVRPFLLGTRRDGCDNNFSKSGQIVFIIALEFRGGKTFQKRTKISIKESDPDDEACVVITTAGYSILRCLPGFSDVIKVAISRGCIFLFFRVPQPHKKVSVVIILIYLYLFTRDVVLCSAAANYPGLISWINEIYIFHPISILSVKSLL